MNTWTLDCNEGIDVRNLYTYMLDGFVAPEDFDRVKHTLLNGEIFTVYVGDEEFHIKPWKVEVASKRMDKWIIEVWFKLISETYTKREVQC